MVKVFYFIDQSCLFIQRCIMGGDSFINKRILVLALLPFYVGERQCSRTTTHSAGLRPVTNLSRLSLNTGGTLDTFRQERVSNTRLGETYSLAPALRAGATFFYPLKKAGREMNRVPANILTLPFQFSKGIMVNEVFSA